MKEFHTYEYVPFLTAHCTIQHWFRLSNCLQAKPFVDETSETNLSLGRMESCWEDDLEEILSHCSQPSRKFQHVTSQRTLWVCQAMDRMALIGNTKQAMSEGKSGSIET